MEPRVTVHPALSSRCPRCSKLCMQRELAFCGEIYIEFRAIILVGLPLLVCLLQVGKKIWRFNSRARCEGVGRPSWPQQRCYSAS